jgi:hypothetical protein
LADVKELYESLVKEGRTPKDAAKEAQARTGVSLVTGRAINRDLDANYKKVGYGQYTSKFSKHGQY